MKKTAVILGAGIQGTCIALMLQKQGFKIQMIDKAERIITRASMSREGKIHMGFIYGMDKTLQTGYRMIHDCANFAPYLEYLLDEPIDWESILSKKNIYASIKGSMLRVDEVEAYFEKLDAEFQTLMKSSDKLNYMGRRPSKLFNKIERPSYMNDEMIEATFLTEEVSVDQNAIRNLLIKKVNSNPGIEIFLEHSIHHLERKGDMFITHTKSKIGESIEFESDILINCLWENRVRFDHAMGLYESVNYSLRLKYGLIMNAKGLWRSMDSVSMIHGSYGNIVVYPNTGLTFCAWYPASMKGIVDYGELTPEWENACNGLIPQQTVAELAKSNLEGFKKYFPALEEFEVMAATAGVILAEGKIDIHDQISLFHKRNEAPILHANGYFSINTGKYTSAPRNTLLLEKMLSNSKM